MALRFVRRFSSTHLRSKPIDINRIRQDPGPFTENAVLRKFGADAEKPTIIAQLSDRRKELLRELRKRKNGTGATLSRGSGRGNGEEGIEGRSDGELRKEEQALLTQMSDLAWDVPNLTAPETPIGDEPSLVAEHTNKPFLDILSTHDSTWHDHVRLGKEFDIIDFESAGSTTGWGWYYLKNEGASLERALVQYALHVALKHGFAEVSPPSMVYSHISNACGFRPREPNSKQLVYSIAQSEEDERSNKLRLSLAATAEIPFAAMKAETSFNEHDLPLRIVGSSRCFRPEAGARGRESRGLFRVHEFTKVEMFAWGMKGKSGQLFDQMLEIQLEILRSLGLSLRVLEMPARDLGHSAYRKRDIEAFFPSRLDRNEGWGEVTSLSMCTDYQTRRLETKVQLLNGSVEYPETVNGTAMAVPRVLAALLEYGWDESERAIKIPECLWPWTDGKKQIEKKL